MSDRQAKIAATMKAGRALRRRSSPTAAATSSDQLTARPTEPARPLTVSLPRIPTGCSPRRESVQRQEDSPFELHATVRSQSDAELLDTPPSARSSRRDLAKRVEELERQLMEQSRSRSPVCRSPRPEEPRGRPAVRQVRQRPARLVFDDELDEREHSPQGSVFSRLGSPVPAAVGLREDSPDRDPVDVNWTTLIDLALQLSGHRRSPSPDNQGAAGLLASAPPAAKARFTFPPSKGVLDSLDKAYGRFTAEADQDCRPESLPSEATTQVSANKVSRNFNIRFHGANIFPLSALSAKPSPEENSYLRPRAEPAVPIGKLNDAEALMRRSLRSMSSLDWLLNTLREVSRLPHQDETVLEALWTNIQKTLGFCTDFTTGAFMSTLVARREAFLKSCDTMKVPRRVHTWAALRPPFSTGRPSLLGDTGDVFRSASREERELAIVSSLSTDRRQQSRSNNSTSNRGNSFRGRDRQQNQRVASVVSRPPASSQQRPKKEGSNSTSNFRRGGSRH